MVYELADAQRSVRETQIWTANETSGSTYNGINHNLSIRYFPHFKIRGVVGSPLLYYELANQSTLIKAVHAHSTFHPLNLGTARAAKRKSIPLFFHAHGALDPSLFRRQSLRSLKKRFYIRFFEVPSYNGSNGVFALSELERQQLLSIGVTAPIHVMPNGIVLPEAKFCPERKEKARIALGIKSNEKVIAYVGRIVPKKGLADILSAYSIVKHRFGATRLLVAGNQNDDPVHAADLLSIDKKLGLNIGWLGFLDEEGKKNVFSASDIFVHGSYSEGMAIAILEAMANAIAVVATKGCYMHAAGKASALMECDQGAKPIAMSLIKLLESDPMRIAFSRTGAEYVRKHHDWQLIAKKIIEIYDFAVVPSLANAQVKGKS